MPESIMADVVKRGSWSKKQNKTIPDRMMSVKVSIHIKGINSLFYPNIWLRWFNII